MSSKEIIRSFNVRLLIQLYLCVHRYMHMKRYIQTCRNICESVCNKQVFSSTFLTSVTRQQSVNALGCDCPITSFIENVNTPLNKPFSLFFPIGRLCKTFLPYRGNLFCLISNMSWKWEIDISHRVLRTLKETSIGFQFFPGLSLSCHVRHEN